MTSRPIRAAIIGLSSSAATSWAATAHLPAFLTPLGRSKFQIVALCNSSVAAAQAAIATYKLDPSSTKAYGSPEDLAADPDVEIVICNTRVDKHYETTLPSVKAGKDVYIEWPIAANAEDIATLVDAADKSGSQALVGLQGRWSAPVRKLREVLARGDIGTVLSVDVRTFGGSIDREMLATGVRYFADRNVGGNVITIGFAHVFDFVQSVVGNVVLESMQSRLQLQRPQVRIRDLSTNSVVETVQSNVPDLLQLHGRLAESPLTDPHATLSIGYRRGQPFPGTPPLTWTINGTKGELRLVAPNGTALHGDADVSIEVHRIDTDEVERVAWDWSDVEKEVPGVGRSVQTHLYAYADWKQGVRAEREWVTIQDAAARAAQIRRILDGFDG